MQKIVGRPKAKVTQRVIKAKVNQLGLVNPRRVIQAKEQHQREGALHAEELIGHEIVQKEKAKEKGLVV